MPTQKFHVPDLAHEDEARVAAELRRLPGVIYAAANHRDECAEVEFEDDEVTADEIGAVLSRLGYEVGKAG